MRAGAVLTAQEPACGAGCRGDSECISWACQAQIHVEFDPALTVGLASHVVKAVALPAVSRFLASRVLQQ